MSNLSKENFSDDVVDVTSDEQRSRWNVELKDTAAPRTVRTKGCQKAQRAHDVAKELHANKKPSEKVIVYPPADASNEDLAMFKPPHFTSG